MRRRIIENILAIVISIIFLLPLISIFLLSIIDLQRQTLSYNQYYLLFKENLEFFYLYFKSFLITMLIVIGQLVISILISYYYARSKSLFSRIMFFVYVYLMILPLQVMLIPTTLLYNQIENIFPVILFDTQWSIILPGIFSTISVFILKQYFSSFPEEYFDNAKIDGASNFDIILKIILPNSMYAILVLSLLLFLEYWNMIEQGLIFLNSASNMPVSLYLNSINYSNKSYIFACVVFFLLPILLFIKLTLKVLINKYKEELKLEKDYAQTK
ncbi:MAG: carbohydrate ABC transporter permease [Clostridiales bacterium]|nr:carbohydrate ABC transporter permease [Clostridiales bacterium]